MPNRVGRTNLVEALIRDLRADIRHRIEAIERNLRDRGCHAADYRLTGETLERLCAIQIGGVTGNWRIVIAFPEPDAVVLLYVGQHNERRGLNIYQDLYTVLGIAEPRSPRSKPSCCDEEGNPPINGDVLERIDLYARQRRRRR